MPTLSSLLVQRGVVPVRVVEDAIARQVFHGGDLATNLLELGVVREDALLAALAESLGLEPAPSGMLPVPPAEVLRLVPTELAARHGMFPLSEEGRILVVAVSEPLSATVEDDLGFALDLGLRQVVSTQLRIRQAIAGCYGVPLDRRLLRLQAKLDGLRDPSPSAAPPPDLLPARMPPAVSVPAPTFASGVPGSERAPARLDARPAPKQPFVDAQQDLLNPAIPKLAPVKMDAVSAPVEPPPARPAAVPVLGESPASLGIVTPRGGVEVHAKAPGVDTRPWKPGSGGQAPHPGVPAPPDNPSAIALANTLRGPAIDDQREEASPRSVASTRVLAGVLRDALRDEQAVDKRRGPTWRGAERRRKGPFTAARAEAELEEATVSEEVLETLFAFAHQFFEYAALFVVHGDLAEGRDASGPGADRATLAGIGVPLDLPSHLADARTRRAPVIARPASSGLDADLVRDLGRGPRAQPQAFAYLPVAVRTRTVAILVGDDGDTDVELSGIGEVISFIGLAGAALERIALRKKMGARAPLPQGQLKVPNKARTTQEGAAALARFAGSAASAGNRPPNPPEAAPPEAPQPGEDPRSPREDPRKESAPSGRYLARDSSSAGLRPLPSTPPPNATGAADAWRRDERPAPAGWNDPRASSVPPPVGTPRDLVASSSQRDLIQRVIEGGHRGRDAFEELVRSGESTVQAVMARFPGPLRVDRHRARGELPPASQCGPLLEVVVAISRPALPFVSSRSSALDAETRFWATHTLGELRYPEAATVLIPRLFDDDAQVRRIARRSAASLVGAGAAGAPILKGLEDITRNSDEPKVHRLVAIETMGEIRSGSLVPPLLDALEDHSEDVADAARRALLLITRQDFGRDQVAWHDWWADNAGRHRIEWLIDALMHEQPSLRRAAGDELKLSTKEYFGYYDDLPKRDRERAQGLYRAWWEREGWRRFA